MFYIQQDEKILLFDEDKQKLQDTITMMPQYKGLEVKEVQEGYVIYDFELMTVEEKEEKEAQKERERLNMLSMTRGDVFEALILAKGLTKPQIRAMIEQAELDTVTKALYLNRFDEALEFYRGYPIFDMLGQALGITSEMLDKFFETRDYTYLIPSEPAEDTSKDTSEQVSDQVTDIVTDQVEEQDENTTDTEQSTDVSNEVETKTTDEPNAN